MTKQKDIIREIDEDLVDASIHIDRGLPVPVEYESLAAMLRSIEGRIKGMVKDAGERERLLAHHDDLYDTAKRARQSEVVRAKSPITVGDRFQVGNSTYVVVPVMSSEPIDADVVFVNHTEWHGRPGFETFEMPRLLVEQAVADYKAERVDQEFTVQVHANVIVPIVDEEPIRVEIYPTLDTEFLVEDETNDPMDEWSDTRHAAWSRVLAHKGEEHEPVWSIANP